MIREVVDGGGRTVGNVGAVGHADYPQPANRGRHATQGRARRWGGARKRCRLSTDGRRTGDGAPYEARRNGQQQIHVIRHPTEGASGTPPPTVVARCRFQRSREVQFITPVALYAARPVSHTPVRGGVPDAPRSCDRRAALGADVWLDRQHPRFPRCAILASTTPRMRSRGHSPRTIFYGSTNVTRQPTPGGRRGNGSERNRRYSSAGAGEISGPTRAVALIFSVSGRRRRLRRSGARRLRGRSSRRRCAVSRRRRI